MNKLSVKYCVALCFCVEMVFAQIIEPSTKPSECQKKLSERGYGMFISYGINTFTDHEWSFGTTPVSEYNPTHLDVDQWIRVARDAGFRYVLLTTKHHDGFCLWDSKYTEYDVAASPVKTDIVAETSKACKKYGLELALYYSLWDRNHPTGIDRQPEAYVDYMCNQLTEILTNYGEVCEMWLDGGWDRPIDHWELPRVYKLIKELQPNCAVGVNHTIYHGGDDSGKNHVIPDSMTVDNKYPIRWFPSDFRLWDPKIAHKLDKKQYLHEGQSYHLPFEHTICMSNYWSWFQKSYAQPTRDLDELEELFYWCTDNDNALVLNLPPDNTGLIRENEANVAIMLARRIGIEQGKPLPKNGEFISMNARVEASSVFKNNAKQFGAQKALDGGMTTRWMANDTTATLTIHLNKRKLFNKISIFEVTDVRKVAKLFSNERTNRIQEYQIDIWDDGHWKTIYADNRPMGDCKVIRFPNSYETSEIRLQINKALAIPGIYEFNVINKPGQKLYY